MVHVTGELRNSGLVATIILEILPAHRMKYIKAVILGKLSLLHYKTCQLVPLGNLPLT